MKLKIAKYYGNNYGVNGVRNGCHECVDETGKNHVLDLTTDASFPEYDSAEDKEAYLESLVGREIEVEHAHPYTPLHFACGVQVLPHTHR